MLTFKQQIYDLFVKSKGSWMATSEIQRRLPGVTSSSIYNTLSVFSLKKPHYLNRRPAGNGNEYSLNESAPPFSTNERAAKGQQTKLVMKGIVAPNPRQPSPVITSPEPVAHPKKIISWADDEKMMMAKEYLRLRNKMMNISSSVCKMQDVLPPDRRKKYVNNRSLVPWLDGCIAQIKAEDSKLKDVLDQIAHPDSSSGRESAENIATEPSTPAPQILPVSLSNASIDDLVGEIGRRIAGSIRGSIIEALQSDEVKNALTINLQIGDQTISLQKSEQELPRIEPAKPTEQTAIPKVIEEVHRSVKIGIVGNRTTMKDVLESAYPHIKFIVTDKKYHEAADEVKSCDRIILLTKFLGHPTINNVKKVAADKITTVHGGLSQVRRTIDMWIHVGMIPKA